MGSKAGLNTVARKVSAHAGNQTPVRPIASHYAKWAIPAHIPYWCIFNQQQKHYSAFMLSLMTKLATELLGCIGVNSFSVHFNKYIPHGNSM
jgi:hypothetical protein